jgi:hypothetical protein
MKTVLLHEYKTKKIIADNLQTLINKRFLNISDEEFTRINNAINDYNTAANAEFNPLNNISSNNSEIRNTLSQLQLEVNAIKDASPVEVEETGLYFVDDDGYIGAKITNDGFFAINLNPNNSGSSSSISGDLTIIDY